ncbi:MAG: hypothetical protein EP318_16860 [Rhodobacteraceae bacterium]|nr:MAG: hypothetical protein EP318_16860 [Paracoccaceae bacterium]
MAKPVFLHIGAHRTGTSSFQMCLDLNRGALQARGFDPAYPGRDGIPGGKLRLRLPGPGRRAPQDMIPRAASAIAAQSADPGRALILSEENIPGRMFHFYQGRFYPAAEARLGVLKAALESLGAPRIARVLLVLRPYDGLFASAYRKRAEDNAVPPFATLVPKFLAMDRGWPALVRAVKTILAPEELLVVDFARRGESRALLHRLVPGLDMELQEPARVMNLSASDAALEALQERYRAGETLERDAWQAVIRAHSDQRAPTGFAGFTDQESRVLSERYAANLDKIARIRGITFLR